MLRLLSHGHAARHITPRAAPPLFKSFASRRPKSAQKEIPIPKPPPKSVFRDPVVNNSKKSREFAMIVTFAFGGIVYAGLGVYFFSIRKPLVENTSDNALLWPTRFSPLTVTDSDECGPNSRLISIQILPDDLPPSSDIRPTIPIWSVYVKDDDIQVERPYTPLEGIDVLGRMSFWIKKYPQGEVGKWLHSKRVGDEIEVRGPLVTWFWQEGKWDEIVMVRSNQLRAHVKANKTRKISGGTGIAPFYQLFHSVISQPSESRPKTRFTLLHASRTAAELPPPMIMEPLEKFAKTNPDDFKFEVFVSEDASGRKNKTRIDKTAIQKALGLQNNWGPTTLDPERKVLFLVCGPDGCVCVFSSFGLGLID